MLRLKGRHGRGAIRRAAWVLALAAGAGLLLGAPLGPAAAEEAGGVFSPDYTEIYGKVQAEGTLFFQEPAHRRQRRDGASAAIEVTALAEWSDGDTVATFTPFFRFDLQDDKRTHVDIRELKLEHVAGDWAFTFGVDREFWGKTEVVHLVDIVNQSDLVEDIDEEERLGQPLFKVSRLTEIGNFAVYYFPYARARTLPGPEGRLRLPVPYNHTDPVFEPAGGQWAPSFALRYTGVFGGVDLGLSAFNGVSRDPAFRFRRGRLQPVYSRITQVGLDAQYTSGATLWKGEAILREGQRNVAFEVETYGALTGGLEHTLYQIADTDADLGLILEGAWDSRGDDALTPFENDVIGGVRLTLNDTQSTTFLLTSSVDVTDGAAVLRLEAERRLTPNITAEIEAQGFVNSAEDAFGVGFGDDSFVRLKLNYFF